jgi:hypothetical protein
MKVLSLRLHLWIILFFCILASPTTYAVDLDPQLLGEWPGFTRGSARCVAARGNYLYAGIGESAFVVFDVSIPSKPKPIGSTTTKALPETILLYGNYAYVTEEVGLLEIIDVTIPTQPKSLGIYSSWGNALLFIGSYAYTAPQKTGFYILDVADPAKPIRSSFFPTAFLYPGLMSVSGKYVYVQHGDGFEILDATDPAHPQSISSFHEGGVVRFTSAFSNTVLLIWENNQFGPVSKYFLQLVDVTDPSNPHIASSTEIAGWVWDIYIANNYAYLVHQYGGLDIFDVANSASPEKLGHFDALPELRFALSGMYGFLANAGRGLDVLDLTNPRSPRKIGGYSSDASTSKVLLSGENALLADGAGGLRILDVKNPQNPILIGESATKSNAVAIALIENHAYVAEGEEGLEIFNVSIPAQPRWVRSVETVGNAHALAVQGNYLYLANDDKLFIFDATDSSNPILLGSFDEPGSIVDFFVSGNYAFLSGTMLDTDSTQGLRVIDISNPALPVRVGQSRTFDPYAITASDKYAYLSDLESGLTIFDISNPASPQRLGNYPGGAAFGMLKSGPYVFSSGYNLEIVDVSNPFKPKPLGRTPFLPGLIGLTISGDYAYLASGPSGFKIYNFAREARPQRISGASYSPGGRPFSYVTGKDLAISGSYAYVLDDWTGIHSFDISDPDNPRHLGATADVVAPTRIAASGNFLYSLDLNRINIFDISLRSTPRKIGSLDRTGSIAVSGNHLYVAGNAFEILDVTEPLNPKSLGTFHTDFGTPIGALTVDGEKVALGLSTGRVDLLDISNPASPSRLGFYISGTGIGGVSVAMKNNFVYFSSPSFGFQIIDFTNPSTPKLLGSLPITSLRSIVVLGNFVYCVSGEKGIEVIDITDPSKPHSVGANHALDYFALLAYQGKILASAEYTALNVFEPFSPPPDSLSLQNLSLTDGAIHFLLTGPAGRQASIERSPSVESGWTAWQTVPLSGVPAKIADSPSPSTSKIFYRAILKP